MYHRNPDVAPDSHLAESYLSSPTISSSVGNPSYVGRQVREVRSPETTSASHTVSSSRAFEATTIEDHDSAYTFAQTPATTATGMDSSWTPSRTNSESSPVIFALDVSSTSINPDNEVTSSQGFTQATAAPYSTTHASTRSTRNTIHPSLSSPASEPATTASPPNIESARTTGIIIGSVLGGLAVLVTISLAILYTVWRRRRRRRDETDRENATQQRSNEEATSGGGETTKERKPSTRRPTTLPLQGVAATPRTLRSEPIIVDAISPITPIMPHLSRWTSEKADIPSPVGQHPAVDDPPHLRHHPVFANTDHYGHDENDEDDEVSPCSSSSPSPGPQPSAPAAVVSTAPAAADADGAALGSFLFFDNDSPSSRSSTRRPSTRDSSAPRTALSMPPPPHRPPPRRRHTRAGGGHGRDGGRGARSRRGSGSSVSGGGDGGDAGGTPAGPPSLPPPLPVRSAARSNSLRDAERPTAWI